MLSLILRICKFIFLKCKCHRKSMQEEEKKLIFFFKPKTKNNKELNKFKYKKRNKKIKPVLNIRTQSK
jgi:hypothetical protein